MSAEVAATGGATRRALLARLHLAKKEMALSDDSYRAILERVTGRRSAGELIAPELHLVLAEFSRLGLKPRHRASGKPHVRKVWALWGALGPALRNPSREGLRAFVARQTGVADPEWLTSGQANKVVEALKAWQRRGGGGAAGAGESDDAG